jgi:hypothetical protein
MQDPHELTTHDSPIFDYAVSNEIAVQKEEISLARLRTIMAHVAVRRTKEKVKLGLVDKSIEVRRYPSTRNPRRIVRDCSLPLCITAGE